MGKARRTSKKKPVRDLAARGAGVRGGRQTEKTDFGSVLGRGITKAADTTAATPKT
jgi:hypothetical protein